MEAIEDLREFELTLLDLRDETEPRFLCELVGWRNEFLGLFPEKLGRDTAAGGTGGGANIPDLDLGLTCLGVLGCLGFL